MVRQTTLRLGDSGSVAAPGASNTAEPLRAPEAYATLWGARARGAQAMKPIILALLAVLLASGGIAQPAPWGWIASDKVRGAYFGQGLGRDHYQRLARAGFNAVFVKYGGLKVVDPAADEDDMTHLKAASAWAQAFGLRFFPVINLGGDNERKPLMGEFRPVVTSRGLVIQDTACPRDAGYWNRVLGDRGVLIARLAREAPISGLILDPEMYGAGIHTYGVGVCFCDDCFKTFLRARDLGATAPPAAERFEYLKARGRLDDYYTFLESEIAVLAARQRERIHAVNAELLLGGFLLDRDDFYHRGLVRGLSAPAMPVLVMPETTYGSGYSEYVPSAIARLKKLEAPFRFVGGLWISKFLPDYIGAHAYHMGINGDGYWLFTTYSLAVPRQELRGDYALPAEAEEYWRALAQANAEISRKMRDSAYESHLVIRPQPPIVPAAIQADMTEMEDVVPAAPLNPNFAPPPVGQLPQLRGRHLFGLKLRKGEGCRLTLACHRLGSYAEGAVLTVTSPAGEEIARVDTGYNKTATVDVNAPKDGVYGVVATAGANTFSLQASAQYCCVVGKGVAFCSRGGRMYFYVPPQTESFAVRVKGGGGEETARIVVYDPAGKEAAAAEALTTGYAEAVAAVPPGMAGQVWSLEVGRASEGTFEDAYVSLRPPLAPALADAPERLLVPREMLSRRHATGQGGTRAAR